MDKGIQEFASASMSGNQPLSPMTGGKSSIEAKDAESLRRGLAKLVLQLVSLLRELMERQAVRRMPYLPPEKQEQLGLHLMLLREKVEEMREYFGIKEGELELGLLGNLDEFTKDALGSIKEEMSISTGSS